MFQHASLKKNYFRPNVSTILPPKKQNKTILAGKNFNSSGI